MHILSAWMHMLAYSFPSPEAHMCEGVWLFVRQATGRSKTSLAHGKLPFFPKALPRVPFTLARAYGENICRWKPLFSRTRSSAVQMFMKFVHFMMGGLFARSSGLILRLRGVCAREKERQPPGRDVKYGHSMLELNMLI